MKETRELFRQKARTERALIDTNYFSKTYFDISLYPNQLEWNEYFEKNPKATILAPVGHAKSHLVAFIRLIQHICKNRNIRIIYGTKTYSLAQDNMRRVAHQLRFNEKLIEDFGTFYDRSNKWTDDRIEIIRTDNTLKEPTMTAVGMGGAIEGTRGDLGVLDDPIDIESMRSETVRRHNRDWLDNTFIPRLEPDARIEVIGSAWHEDDLYNYIADKPNLEVKLYTAILDDEKQIVLCPERWTYERLQEKKKEIGTSAFNLRFMNDRTASEGVIFKKDWLTYYDALKNLGDLKIYQGWDLAISEKETADYTSCVTIGLQNNEIYILEVYRARISFPEQVRMVQSLGGSWRPIKIGIESNAYQRALAQHMREVSMLPIVEVKTVKDKVTRMQALSVHFENGRIKTKRDFLDFETEYKSFPYGKHDDILDALEIAVSCAISAKKYGPSKTTIKEMFK